MRRVRVGVDFGGVLGTPRPGAPKGSFGELRIEVEGAFDAIRELVRRYGARNVFIVSRCQPETEKKIKQWLKEQDFFKKTGFRRRNIRFCLERADKAPIARRLKLTHFVDDHADVLWPMLGIVSTRIVLTYGAVGRPIMQDDAGLILTSSWRQVIAVITRTA